MRGKKYKLKVYHSVLHWTHGMGEMIEEVFLPEAKVAFNKYGAFRTDEERYEKKKDEPAPELLDEVEVDDDDVEELQRYLKIKEDVERIIGKYLKRVG